MTEICVRFVDGCLFITVNFTTNMSICAVSNGVGHVITPPSAKYMPVLVKVVL